MTTALKKNKATDFDSWEPVLAGDLNERFFKAVNEETVLHYDVVQTGMACKNIRKDTGLSTYDEKTPYDIVLLHGANVDDTTLTKMMALQTKVAAVQAPSSENAIDYKSEEEIISHYSAGGLGFGIFTVSGELIGQVLLSFNQKEKQASINWLMVDSAYRGNLLCDNLIGLSVQIAESSGMEKIGASVRIGNPKGIRKFSAKGFIVDGAGTNVKDGSTNVKFFKPVNQSVTIGEETYPRPLSLNGLQSEEQIQILDSITDGANVAKWDFEKKWFTVHSYAVDVQPVPLYPVAKGGFGNGR